MDEQTGFDPRNRRLCPDGTCTGVIGADGRCGECGRLVGGGGGGSNGTTGQLDEHAPLLEATDGAEEPVTSGSAGDSGFDPNRRLCEDGACVGVIGANGACAVCGRVAG